jgi:hypothetical protein
LRVTFNDFDQVYDYLDSDGLKHSVALRDMTVEQLLAVVVFYKLHQEASWNESPLTECIKAAMPKWRGEMADIDKAIRRYWPDRPMIARPYRDV